MSNILAKNDINFMNALIDAQKKNNREILEKSQVAISAFMAEPKRLVSKQIQAVSVSTDFEQVRTNAFNVTVAEDNFDLGYEAAFRVVPIDPQRDFWEIYDVDNGLSFRRVEEGGRIRVEGMTGEVQQVYVDYYGGALGWTDKMIRFRKVAPMIDRARIFRNRFWTNKADNHYLLLAVAAAGNVTAYQGVAADGELQRDIQTINQGNFTLRDRLKDKGYGDTANVQILGYYNPRDTSRIEAAMRATTNNGGLAPAGRTGRQVNWSIRWIKTFNSNISSGSPILVFPGQKIQRVDVMQPTTYTMPKDPLTLNELQAVWAIYGAAVADTDQCEQLTLG